ncbi:MAG: acyl-CoA thioesterase [Chlorobi bacterium]|nr:acyl-CoA thioesterase [Chlorobiota bacterium]
MITDKKLKQLQPGHFHSVTEIMVRYRDLDTFNHVNNAVYFSYLESGRLQYNHKYLGNLIDWKERGFILGTNHMIYVHPLFLFDRVRIYTGVGRMGRRSVTFVNLLTNQEGVHVAYGYSVLVAYDFIRGRSIDVPSSWRERFEKTDRFLLDMFSE